MKTAAVIINNTMNSIAINTSNAKSAKKLFVFESILTAFSLFSVVFTAAIQIIYGFDTLATIAAGLGAFCAICTGLGAKENRKDWQDCCEAVEDDQKLLMECEAEAESILKEAKKALETEPKYEVEKPCPLTVEYISSKIYYDPEYALYAFTKTEKELVFFEIEIF